MNKGNHNRYAKIDRANTMRLQPYKEYRLLKNVEGMRKIFSSEELTRQLPCIKWSAPKTCMQVTFYRLRRVQLCTQEYICIYMYAFTRVHTHICAHVHSNNYGKRRSHEFKKEQRMLGERIQMNERERGEWCNFIII